MHVRPRLGKQVCSYNSHRSPHQAQKAARSQRSFPRSTCPSMPPYRMKKRVNCGFMGLGILEGGFRRGMHQSLDMAPQSTISSYCEEGHRHDHHSEAKRPRRCAINRLLCNQRKWYVRPNLFIECAVLVQEIISVLLSAQGGSC